MTSEAGLRLDKWLWHARFVRRRELAAQLVDVDLLAVEFNHDVAMQHASGRTLRLIERVLGDEGHLSNVQAAALVRAVLERSTPGRLLLVVHHLAVDGVSWRILAQDLATAWDAIERRRKPDRPWCLAEFHRHTNHADVARARMVNSLDKIIMNHLWVIGDFLKILHLRRPNIRAQQNLQPMRTGIRLQPRFDNRLDLIA